MSRGLKKDGKVTVGN